MSTLHELDTELNRQGKEILERLKLYYETRRKSDETKLAEWESAVSEMEVALINSIHKAELAHLEYLPIQHLVNSPDKNFFKRLHLLASLNQLALDWILRQHELELELEPEPSISLHQRE